ncbi:sialin-like isoform X2 [Ischnura elegans]|uniref:sialin-like isoform X2 n=1 Tax=Ischnura elegans TaxID=197161 RepID=UPI001ED8AAF0|nr:sialin-like isoform X2 [Ischnura elegans]
MAVTMDDARRISQVPRPKGWIQRRYVLAVMGSICIMMMFILKVNFSVGLVAMVKPVSQHNTSNGTLHQGNEGEEGEFDWDIETQGNILAAYFYGYVATQMLGGYAASRWGGKVVVGPGIALTGFFTLFTPVAARQGGPWALFAVRVLQGLCSGIVMPGMQYLFSQWFPPQEHATFSGAVFSAMHSGTVIGMAASGPLSKWPLEGGGWPMVFYFFGAIGAALIVPWWLLVFDSPECHPRISEQEKNYILAGQGTEKKAMKHQTSAPLPWLSILTDIHVWAAIIYQWSSGWVLYIMLSDIPTYMKNILHFDIQKLAFLSAVPSLLTWIASVFSGIVSQWIRKKKYLSHRTTYLVFNAIAALGSAAALIAVAQVGYDPDTIVILLSVSGLLSGAFFGGSYLNHLDLAINYAGAISGILHTVSNSSGIFVPIVVAAIVEEEQTVERWSIVFYTGAFISIAAYVLYFFFGSVQERPWNNPKKLDQEAT